MFSPYLMNYNDMNISKLERMSNLAMNVVERVIKISCWEREAIFSSINIPSDLVMFAPLH